MRLGVIITGWLAVFAAVVLFADLVEAMISTHFHVKSFRTECIKRNLVKKAVAFITVCIAYLFITILY